MVSLAKKERSRWKMSWVEQLTWIVLSLRSAFDPSIPRTSKVFDEMLVAKGVRLTRERSPMSLSASHPWLLTSCSRVSSCVTRSSIDKSQSLMDDKSQSSIDESMVRVLIKLAYLWIWNIWYQVIYFNSMITLFESYWDNFIFKLFEN